MTTILDGLIPADLSLPPQFLEFRDIQRELVDYALYGPDSDGEVRRFMCIGAPAGAGKQLAAFAIARMSGLKTVILTATRALEDQAVDAGFDCVNVRGKANYTCLDYNPLHPDIRWSCDEGMDKECPHCDKPTCAYRQRVGEAQEARVVITNYAYWLYARLNNRQALETKGERIELLICDEAHLAFGALASFLSTWVSSADLHRFADKEIRAALTQSRGAESGRLGPTWTEGLLAVWNGALKRQAEIKSGYETEAQAARGSKEYRTLDKLCGNLNRLVGHAWSEAEEDETAKIKRRPNWLWRLTRNGISFDVIWPGRYAERYLWSGVPRIVPMSASLRPKGLVLTGVKQAENWFREWPRIFPAELSPVYWLKTGRMGQSASMEEKRRSIESVDAMCDEWREYKGIIHTTSYVNAEWYQTNSKWGRTMILSKPGEQVAAADKYRAAKAPCQLVSPSFTTGFDFPEEDCGYQIIPKLPFPDRSDPVFEARDESDDGYSDYVTMQTLFQACGRKSRRADQRCITLITDDAVQRFRRYAAVYAPRYFHVRDIDHIPHAPQKTS